MKAIGWGWAGVIWLYSIVFYIPLDILKFIIKYALSGKAWNNITDNRVKFQYQCYNIILLLYVSVDDVFMCYIMQTAFTTKKDYGRGEREAQWAAAQRTLHGLNPPETEQVLNESNNYRDLSELAEQAKKRAEIARY